MLRAWGDRISNNICKYINPSIISNPLFKNLLFYPDPKVMFGPYSHLERFSFFRNLMVLWDYVIRDRLSQNPLESHGLFLRLKDAHTNPLHEYLNIPLNTPYKEAP